MALLFATHERYFDHIAAPGHPERPERLRAVLAGSRDASIADAILPIAPRRAERHELELAHPAEYLDALQRFSESGGGMLDPDTGVNGASWDAAVLAAGALLRAIEGLQAGEGGAPAAFCAVRPPGHHAMGNEAMGFCLVNNVAVAAANLAAQGERVLIVDYDAHHGNGTQAIFEEDPRVFYVSFHQWPLYPGTGRMDDRGLGAGFGTTLNLPLPPGATGDIYLEAFDSILVPLVRQFGPTWLIISAGFDAHRRDPLTQLGLTSGDYAILTSRLAELVPKGRVLVVLEGGYDLQALRDSSAATMAALLGFAYAVEEPTSGGPGRHVVAAVKRLWDETPMV